MKEVKFVICWKNIPDVHKLNLTLFLQYYHSRPMADNKLSRSIFLKLNLYTHVFFYFIFILHKKYDYLFTTAKSENQKEKVFVWLAY